MTQDFCTLVLERICSHERKVLSNGVSHVGCPIILVEIVGVNSPTNGRSCEEHRTCGEIVIEDVVLCLRKVQVWINQQAQSAIAAFWVSDGIDRCRVGYLPKAYVKNWKQYDGALVQVY